MREMFFLIAFLFIIEHCISQHVFEKVSTCEYQHKKEKLIFQDVPLNFVIQNKQAYFSLCGRIGKRECNSKAAACILDSTSPSASIRNAGQYFLYNIEQNNKKVLRSMNGQKCARYPKKNHTVVIHLNCDDFLKHGPVPLRVQDCEYHVMMLDPICSPKCAARIGRQNDLLDLETVNSYGDIRVESDDKMFYVSVCGPAQNCSSDLMACEKNGNDVRAIADINTQHVNYNSQKGILSVRGHTGPRRGRQYTELFLKCKWGLFDIKAKYLKPSEQGSKYRFELESQHFCLKLPTDCTARKRQFFYDLSSLHRKTNQDQWTVRDKNGMIVLNVCGPLKSDYPGTCREEHSQVCFLSRKSSETINLGMSATQIQVTDDDTVTLTYTDGSRCTDNETYSTEIIFTCSDTEGGPKINSSDGCKYTITWQTPAACPTHLVEGNENCHILEDNGYRRNISSIHTDKDRIQAINANTHLRFNLCGPLSLPCGGVNQTASVCLVRNGQEVVVGWDNRKLTSRNGILELKLEDSRSNFFEKTRTTTVYFYCDHKAPTEGTVSLNYTGDLNNFTLSIRTPLACVSNTAIDCILNAPNCKYDLSPLSTISGNYVVKNGTDEYIINVCRPVINTNDHLCPIDSSVCLKRNSEPHLEYKYKNFGSVGGPKLVNNELVIQNTFGGYCRESEMLVTSSVIHFRCSNREQPPTVLKKDACSVEFLWYTKYACSTPANTCQFNLTSSIYAGCPRNKGHPCKDR